VGHRHLVRGQHAAPLQYASITACRTNHTWPRIL
jgi:hypothetical protein